MPGGYRRAGNRSWTRCPPRAVSQASPSGSVRLSKPRTRIELLGPGGELVYDTYAIDHEEGWPVLRAECAAAVR